MKKLFFILLACAFMPACSLRIVEPSRALSAQEHLELASIYERNGDHGLALSEYENAADAGLEASAYFGMANVLLKEKKYQEAVGYYLKAADLEPRAEIYNNLAWAYMESGDYANARKAVEAALLLDPRPRHAYLDTLGAIYLRQGELANAEKALLDAAKAAPAHDRAGLGHIYSKLAELYEKAGDTEKAAEFRVLQSKMKEGL